MSRHARQPIEIGHKSPILSITRSTGATVPPAKGPTTPTLPPPPPGPHAPPLVLPFFHVFFFF